VIDVWFARYSTGSLYAVYGPADEAPTSAPKYVKNVKEALDILKKKHTINMVGVCDYPMIGLK
jgi:hypothetical protein